MEALIPVTIGVTGHRDLLPGEIPALREAVKAALSDLRAAYPHSPFTLLCSLAAGADCLCAEIALELGMRLVCPLPRDAADYKSDFSPAGAALLDGLLDRADEAFTVPRDEPDADDPKALRGSQFRQTGLYVARHCHILLALWDGSAPRPGGCGTAEAVDFMLRGGGPDGLFQADGGGTVLHIAANRAAGPRMQPGCRRWLDGGPEPLTALPEQTARTLRLTDEMNAALRKCPPPDMQTAAARAAERAGGKAPALYAMQKAAGRLAQDMQEKTLRALRAMAWLGIGLVLAFLLYDEMESNLFLPVYALLLLASGLCLLAARRGRWHGRYLRYRLLSETFRAQLHLALAGVEQNVCARFTWTQRRDAGWAEQALSSVMAGPQADAPLPDGEVRALWIDAQLAYHARALARDEKRRAVNARLSGFVTAASVLLFLATLALELFGPTLAARALPLGPLRDALLMHPGQELLVRGVLKLALGTVSAVTVFLSGYYGKLALERSAEDHERMLSLYRRAAERFGGEDVSRRQLFWELAGEELIDSGNWYSYSKDGAPGANL